MNKEYESEYLSHYLPSYIKHGECEECHNIGVLMKEGACGDYHTAGDMCCYKYICYDGCRRVCKCGATNRVYMSDGYAVAFKCYNCNEKNDVNITWWGNTVMESCKRYCRCSLMNWDGVVKGGDYFQQNEDDGYYGAQCDFDYNHVIKQKNRTIQEFKDRITDFEREHCAKHYAKRYAKRYAKHYAKHSTTREVKNVEYLIIL